MAKKTRNYQLRLLPVTIFVAGLMLSVRVSDIYSGLLNLGSLSLNPTQAQQPTPPNKSKPQSLLPPAAPAAPAPPPSPGQAPAPAQAAPLPMAVAPPPLTFGTPSAPPAVTPSAIGSDSGEAPTTYSQTELDVLQKLSERREALDARDREMGTREGLLKAAETRIDKKVVELKALQTMIEGLLKKYDEQEDAKMASLVKIYENMKPKDAAKIFEQLDMPILLSVIERMKEQKVAPVMAEMDPAKAKVVTAELAQRRQLPRPSATSSQASGGG